MTIATSDADGDTVTKSYQWQKNTGSGWNDLVGRTSATLDLSVAGNGDNGDQLRVVITPNDGSVNGASLTSASVTVGNTAPVMDTATVDQAADRKSDA